MSLLIWWSIVVFSVNTSFNSRWSKIISCQSEYLEQIHLLIDWYQSLPLKYNFRSYQNSLKFILPFLIFF
jgi:hypothetical protein